MNSPVLILLILFVVFRFLAQTKEDKKKAAEKARRQAVFAEMEAKPAAQTSPMRAEKKKAAAPSGPKQGSLTHDSKEGRAFGGSMDPKKREWTAPAAVRVQSADESVTVGGQDIPEDAAYSLKVSEKGGLRLDPQSARQAFVLSEILGKPKALRQSR